MAFKLSFTSPGPVASAFMASGDRVRALRGPIGSGKSVACCVEMMRMIMSQKPNSQGVRKTRMGVTRNTNPELRTTTIKTWLEWFGDESLGRFLWSSPYLHKLDFMLPDQTRVVSEVYFLALDRPADFKKLLSFEFSAVFVNEAREIPKIIIDGIDSRLGRYPGAADGGCTRPALIMDTNAPPEDHWWAIMSGEVLPPEYMGESEVLSLVKPEGWSFFAQPGAVIEVPSKTGQAPSYIENPDRENQQGLSYEKYYKPMLPGKTKTFIDVYLKNKYASLFDGRPVYPSFVKETNVSPHKLAFTPGVDVLVGVDFGRTPAAVLCQLHPGGRWTVLHEIIGVNVGARQFVRRMKADFSRLDISQFTFRFYGDPSGADMGQADDTSPFQMFRTAGIPIKAAPTNDPIVRIEGVEQVLDRMVEGRPGLLISPNCTTLIAGFEGGYKYEPVSGMHNEYRPTPDKNRFSHPHDALQYAFAGGGEARLTLTGKAHGQATRATVVGRGRSPFARMGSRARG